MLVEAGGLEDLGDGLADLPASPAAIVLHDLELTATLDFRPAQGTPGGKSSLVGEMVGVAQAAKGES